MSFVMMLMLMCDFVFFFKQKTAYEMRISDWSSDVCSSDLISVVTATATAHPRQLFFSNDWAFAPCVIPCGWRVVRSHCRCDLLKFTHSYKILDDCLWGSICRYNKRTMYWTLSRSEEHTSELQSLMRNSYAVFSLTKKTRFTQTATTQKRAQ